MSYLNEEIQEAATILSRAEIFRTSTRNSFFKRAQQENEKYTNRKFYNTVYHLVMEAIRRKNKLDAFVFDEIILKYLIKTEYPAHLRVLSETFDHYFISMAIPQGSRLREPLNMALLRIIKNGKLDMLVKQYLGSDS